MRKASLLTLAFLLTGLVSLFAAVDLTGDWEYSMTTQRGPMTQQMKLVQDGEKLTVTMISQRGETKGEGTVKGSDVQWTIVRQGRDGQEMKINYKGKIVDDNTLQGTIEGGFGGGGGTPMEWKAVRKPK